MRNWLGHVRDAAAVANAHWWLRGAEHLGRRVRLRGRPSVDASGSIIIGDRVQLVSTVARIELGTGDQGVLRIGARSLVNYGCSIAALESVTIGERCLIGPHCMIIDSDFHDIDPERRLERPRPPSDQDRRQRLARSAEWSCSRVCRSATTRSSASEAS